MSKENQGIIRPNNAGGIASIVIPISLFLLLLNIHGSYQMCVCVTVILLMIRRNNFEWNLTKTDLAVAAITVLWMISPLWSPCRTSAIRAAGLSLSLLGFYSLMRMTFRDPANGERLINLTAVAFGVAELVAILTFYYHYKEAHRLGFTDLYPIRYLFHPFAESNNCWAQISLIGLCICSLSTRLGLITTCMCSIGALLTFSRGAYLAMALIIASICFWSIKLRYLKKALVGIAVGIVTVSTLFPGETSTVLSGTSTESQRKSLIWRKDSSEKALDVFRSHMVLGTGSRSYSMVCDIPDRSDSAFSNYPPNLLSEILVEKGLVGIIVYGWLLSLIIINAYSNRTTALINTLILIILLKDMTHATLQSSLSGSFAFIMLLAMGQSYRPETTGTVIRNPSYPVCMGIGMLAMLFFPTEYFRSGTERHLISAITELRKGNDDEATRILQELSISGQGGQDPYPDLLLVGLLIRQNRHPEAEVVIGRLKDNSGYKLFYRGMLYLQPGDTTCAVEDISRALSKVPSLARCREYQRLDAAIRTVTLDHALMAIDSTTYGQNSIKGALLHYGGLHEQSERYLRSALDENPALQVPYRLLGDNERYRFLKYGALLTPADNSGTGVPGMLDLIMNEYSSRYRIWYSIKQ